MASYADLQFAVQSSKKIVRGLEWPVLLNNTGGMFSNNYNEESIKDGLIQLLLTSRGERPMLLDYGTALRRSVFAPLDGTTVSELRRTILGAIAKYEDRVIVRSFEIIPRNDDSEIDIELEFSMKGGVIGTDKIRLTVTKQGPIIYGGGWPGGVRNG